MVAAQQTRSRVLFRRMGFHPLFIGTNMKKLSLFLLLAGSLLLGACSPPPPIKIGFIGGLTDRNSDNGQSGLNGVILAVEQFNRAGGVDGRLVELLPKDDAQDKAVAAKSSEELVAAQVEAVVGPFTSSSREAFLCATILAPSFAHTLFP